MQKEMDTRERRRGINDKERKRYYKIMGQKARERFKERINKERERIRKESKIYIYI